MGLNDINSLSHTKWNCKYHIVFAPKYRRKVFYGQKKKEIGKILRQLCEWKGVKILEAEVCPDKLKERFFRGDASRTGEGNGLGLAITDSLCTAQGVRFVIETDADLFKAYIHLPLIQ